MTRITVAQLQAVIDRLNRETGSPMQPYAPDTDLPAAPNTPTEPLRGPVWPFPAALLDYPSLPPCARPVGPPAVPLPDEPALF